MVHANQPKYVQNCKYSPEHQFFEIRFEKLSLPSNYLNINQINLNRYDKI